MNQRPRVSKLVISLVASMSLVVGFSVAPVAGANASVPSGTNLPTAAISNSGNIATKKLVLTTEQKRAKKALAKAIKDLKVKEKNLKIAVKAQRKTAKALVKATKAVEVSQIRALNSPTSSAKAKARAAAKRLKSAKAKDDRALALIARRTVLRDIAQAKVIRLDAKYAWLINDISTLDCGAGTDVATPSGAIEHVWECGIVYKHEDGDTTHVKTTENKLVEVRNIGLQTPERKKASYAPQCGAEEAYQNFMNLMPEEITIVQLRSITNGTNGWGGGSRPTRSVYKLNNATGKFDIDVQAEQIKAGWSMWWPLAAEWAHNKEYLDYMNDAKARGVGIWNPNLCGPATGSVPLIWFNANAPTIDGNSEPAFGEYVILKNDTTAPMDLTGWSLRDNSLNFFWNSENGAWMQGLNKFGSLVLNPGEHRIIYLDNPNGYPLSSTEYEYFNWVRNTPGAQLTNPSINGNYANGDGIYLQDPYGNMRASITNPCTSSALCLVPQWVADITSNTRLDQIIPIPVALYKVADATRDRYNPIVSLPSGTTAAALKTSLTTAGFTVLDGNSYNSPFAKGFAVAVTDLGIFDGVNSVVGLRRAIADLLGKTRTTLYVHAATGNNTVPTLIGLTEADATAAVIAAGFTVGNIKRTTDVGASGVVSQMQTGVKEVGTSISFTVNTPPAP